jgi:hypothetical protein
MLPIVAMRSSFEPGKGIEDFIDAAVLVSWTEPTARFMIIGCTGAGHDQDLGAVLYRQCVLDRIKRLHANDRIEVVEAPVDVSRLLTRCLVVVPGGDPQDLAEEIGRRLRAPDPPSGNYG